jgi:predicted RecA/RadA family phage recombinase
MGIVPSISTKTVATAGTRVQAGTAGTYVTSIYFEALKTNTGVIYVGDISVSSTLYMTALSAGSGFTVTTNHNVRPGSSSGGNEVNLGSLYVDAGTSGDKVQVSYMQRLGTA